MNCFTVEGWQAWERIPPDLRRRLQANVWCAHGCGETSIVELGGLIQNRHLVLEGRCGRCGKSVARVIERVGEAGS